MIKIKKGYRIPVEQKRCKFGSHFSDSVPMPFGSGNCSMPGFECTYEGDKIIPDDFVCEENNKCVAFEPEDTLICPKHDVEYFKECGCILCHPEREDW